mgnify:CR=1 FL=1
MKKPIYPFTRCTWPQALLSSLLLSLSLGGAGMALAAEELPMKIHLDVDGQRVTATLDDSAAARDFAALLPLSLTLEDYAVIERIAYLPRKLVTTGAPAGVTPKAGDLNYYAPWGNLAIFLGANPYARGLVRLGKVDTGLAALQRPGPLQVRIERITD